jgi:hypothetical protein
MRFLAQSDFWEWEMENLIYSFTNLSERQKTWKSTYNALEKLGNLGIAIDDRVVRKARPRVDHWSTAKVDERVAPVKMLAETIEIWNCLIDVLEAQFIRPMRDKAEKWNVETRNDLSSLRKQMPRFDAEEDKGA